MILDDTSLARTLWNLEEARWAGGGREAPEVEHALAWVTGRFRQAGAYGGTLFAPTARDHAEGLSAPTGEKRSSRAGLSHVLGEEAIAVLAHFGVEAGWERDATLALVRDRFEDARQPGWYCCGYCTMARWRALSAARPADWEGVGARGLQGLSALPLDDSGRWRRAPLYYTLLALSGIPLPEVEPERRRIRPAAERALVRLGDDQAGRFRRRAVEWTLGCS